jgi:hypothetical protein
VTQMYRMSDRPDGDKAAIPIEPSEAKRWNTPELGFGIFATVNTFNGKRRKENLTKINAWAIDMDEGTKAEQHARIHASPLIPSLVVETKRGFQAYWCATVDPVFGAPRAEHWNAIVLERLVPHFGSDANARDLCRILRVPNTLHLKDPSDPFRIRLVWKHVVAYTTSQMRDGFAWVPNRKAHEGALREAQRAADAEAREHARRAAVASGMAPTETLWEAIWNLDCEDGLGRLSGHWSVGGEAYTFHRTGRGNLNLFVDGKSSSCFIDANKKIGSLDGGGPTLVQWLRWFKHDWKTVVAVLKEIYPHLADVDDAAKKAKAA